MTRPASKLCPVCGHIIPTVEVNLSDKRVSETHYRLGNHGRANRKGCDMWKKKCPGSGKRYPIPPHCLAADPMLGRLTDFTKLNEARATIPPFRVG